MALEWFPYDYQASDGRLLAGIIQIVAGIGLITLDALGIARENYARCDIMSDPEYYGAPGIWSGLLFILAGVVALGSSQVRTIRNPKKDIDTALISTAINAVVTILAMALFVVSAQQSLAGCRLYYTSYTYKDFRYVTDDNHYRRENHDEVRVPFHVIRVGSTLLYFAEFALTAAQVAWGVRYLGGGTKGQHHVVGREGPGQRDSAI